MRRASRLVARALLSGGRHDSAAGLTAAPDAVPGAWCHSVARHLMSGTLSQRPHSAAEAALSSNEQLGGAPPWDAPPTAPAAAQPVPGEHSGSSPHTSAPATVHAGEAHGAGPKAAKGPHSQPGQQRLARQPRHSSSPRKQTPRLQQAQAGDQEQQQHQHRQRWPQQQRQHRQWQQPQKARPGLEPTHAPAAKKLWSLPRSKPENNPVAWQRHLVFGLLHNIETCREVLQLLQDHAARRQLSARELTVACSRMGKVFTALYKESGTMGGNADNNTTHCAGVFDIVAKNLSVLDTQGLATSIWMAARFHYMPPQEQRTAWETAVWERREEMSLIEISNVFFSLGVLHWDPRVEVMEALLDRALERQRELTPWMVCNMMWGCARLTSFHPGPKRMVQMLEALLPQLDAFKPESFCAVLFSLACLRCRPDDAALTALLDALEWRLKEANNRQLVTMVWALGALQLGELVTERLWDGIDARLLMQEEQLNFSSAPFYFFGAARLQMAPSGELLQMLLSKAVALRSELRTGDVSVILWGLAKLGHVSGEGPVSKRFVQTMIERFMEHDVEAPATLRQLSSFLWSLALLTHPPPQKVLDRCISAADSQATQSQGGLSSTDASMLLSAFETFGSAEGLALLQRHIIGTGEDEVSADVDLTDELRPDVQL